MERVDRETFQERLYALHEEIVELQKTQTLALEHGTIYEITRKLIVQLTNLRRDFNSFCSIYEDTE